MVLFFYSLSAIESLVSSVDAPVSGNSSPESPSGPILSSGAS